MSAGFSAYTDQSLMQTFANSLSSGYVALMKAVIGPAKSPVGIAEWTTADSSSYVRVAAGASWPLSSFSQTTGITITNGTRIQFPALPAGAAPVQYFSVAIFDAATGGNLLAFNDYLNGVTVYPGEIADWEIGQMSFNVL